MSNTMSLRVGALVMVATLGLGCDGGGSGSSGATASTTASSSATAAQSATAEPTASAQASAVPLVERLAGAAPDGIERSGQRLGVPAGWQKGDFGEVRTANKDGYASLYDLPQFPPALNQVELRANSMGCRPVKLQAAQDAEVGAKKVAAKVYEGTGTFDGAPAAVWAVAVNIDKTDNPKVIVVAIKEAARSGLEKDIPAIVQGYADSW